MFLKKAKAKMKSVKSLFNFSCDAQQVAMPSYWSAITISNDRHPEGRSRVREGSGYA
jgi:hypothetical protein